MLGWTQSDRLYRFSPVAAWVEPRQGNLYQYVLGNPVRYVDLDGLSTGDCNQINKYEGHKSNGPPEGAFEKALVTAPAALLTIGVARLGFARASLSFGLL